MPIPISDSAQISPGDLYEDAFYHPCIAVVVRDDEICGVSLVDGSYPRCVDLQRGDVRKLTVSDAWRWRLCGPADVHVEPSVRWWTDVDVAEFGLGIAPSSTQATLEIEDIFYFAAEAAPVGGDTYVVQLRPGIEHKGSLHDELASRLMFPGYYGKNWDALSDVLCDLSWTTYYRIRLDHADLPLENHGEDARKYLQILRDAGRFWQSTSDHRLIAVFPPRYRHIIDELLADPA